LAFQVLCAVSHDGAYANLELARQLGKAGFSERDAAFATELVAGTCRFQGSYDLVIERASGRALNKFQPAVIDLLRMTSHELLSMRIPAHAAIDTSVEIAAARIGRRVTGLVNAVSRRISERDFEQWLDLLAEGMDELGQLALRSHHPRWIVQAFAERLPEPELALALAADNSPPAVQLAVRPGLLDVRDLPEVEPARYSPYGAYAHRPPASYAAVRAGLAGVQDEGSQLMALALANADAPAGPWLDMCAGPGGKAALLRGLAGGNAETLLASELRPHRAELVRQNLAAYSDAGHGVIVADGTRPPWREASFAKVLLDAPCTGLGALRRRPESRWRRGPAALAELAPLQQRLLAAAVASTMPSGVIAYVTCSPHLRETWEAVESLGPDAVEILSAAEYLPNVPDAADGGFVQLWPHRHNTDAMFLALLRRR
jgi:16S rRNA (cytosine967-C5)-methyltransferase